MHFWRAAITVLKGASVFAEKYAVEAEHMAKNEKDPKRKLELEQMAQVCRNVPMDPPRNFVEAVQSFWFTYLLGHIEGSHLGYSPGRVDMLLYPYYKNDPDITPEKATALFEEMFVRSNTLQV